MVVYGVFRSFQTLRVIFMQRTLQGFEWVVRDVHKLRDYLEGVDSIDLNNPDFEILKDSPMLGGHTFKLEIGTRYRTSVGFTVC